MDQATRLRQALKNAFRSKGFTLFGPRFAFDYLRFALRANRHWGATTPGVLNMLGHRIQYFNQSHALFLLHEVFVNATYGSSFPHGRPRIVDCGANIGMACLFFKALYPLAEITAVEADPVTFERLADNVRRNRLRGVRLINAALAEHEGMVTLYGNSDDAGGLTTSLDAARGGPVARQVRAVRLSSLLEGPIDLLKLDIEGAEHGVIRDLIATEAIDRVRESVVEYHDLASDPGASERTLAALDAAGFEIDRVSSDPAARAGVIRATRRAHAPIA